ncbi:MAG: N-acetyltransferase [Thermotaleaceae bacterium]
MKIKRAVMADTEGIYSLVEQYADQGLLLHRTRASIYEHLQCFFVAVGEDGEILGATSLHILDADLAEIRSLVVASEAFGKGIGRDLVNTIIEETKRLGINRLISLTYQDIFFEKCGFVRVEKETLSQKMWKDCINCPKLESCDEIAMQINL